MVFDAKFYAMTYVVAGSPLTSRDHAVGAEKVIRPVVRMETPLFSIFLFFNNDIDATWAPISKTFFAAFI